VTAASLAVVVSTYNAPHFLSLVLEGYRQQTDHNFSVYVADDGSTEETKELIRKIKADFPVTLHHVWHEDTGFRKARIHNQVIRQVHEEYILLTDGDCIPLPGLVAAHRKFAGDDYFISGSRILLSNSFTNQLCQCKQMETAHPLIWWCKQRMRGNINRLFPLLLPPTLSKASGQLKGIRGCHLGCPTEALIHINGFDESFEGWGREDSDLTARLLHAGFSRRNLRGLPVLHLWHQEFSRQHLEKNDTLLQDCLKTQRISAISGIKELTSNE